MIKLISQSSRHQTSGYPFIYDICGKLAYASIVLPLSRFTPLKSMKEGHSQM